MANTNFLAVDELDFDSLKNSLKNYLKNNPRFQDIDFEASNIGMLLDLLSYNTYHNAYYLNMIGNEAFLDTALIKDSVTSHAKELNYLPRSTRSASASVRVNVAVTNNDVSSISIPRFTKFSAKANNTLYMFSNFDPVIIVRQSNGSFISDAFDIKEGLVVTEYFTVNTNISNQRFTLSNKNADISDIQVYVHPSNTDLVTKTEYTQATSLYGVNSISKVFFVQPSLNEKYEVVFGDNVFGYKPLNNNIVAVTYRVSKGSEGNGISSFSAPSIDGYTVTTTTLTSATGGDQPESIDSIKYMAPRHFSTQERAIVPSDYKTLILSEFPSIKSVFVYGGEEIEDSPQYGKVYISLSTQDGTPAIDATKEKIRKFITTRNPISIEPVIVDPDYLYLDVTSNVTNDVNNYQYSLTEVRAAVINSIKNFNDTYLESFETPLRYSKLVNAIDSTLPSIISNDTSVIMMKKIIPVLNTNQNVTLNYGNKFDNQTRSYSVISTNFVYDTYSCFIKDDLNGILQIYRITSSGNILYNTNIGSVDYVKGIVRLSNFNISDYTGDSIRFSVFPSNKDITPFKNNIILINTIDGITVNVSSA